jgi:hypothetical protein
MQSVLTRVFQGLAWLVLAGLAVQFYLAGAALFGATTFQAHRTLGYLLAVAILLLLVVALVARPGRRLVGLTALLAGLAVVQVLLPALRSALPWVAALHVIVAVGIAAQAAAIARVPGRATGSSRSPDIATAVGSSISGW